ncbi:MAG: glycerol-3-phosphate dehydrogenase [Calditrichaeota bacterium]|nr:MAG: glycerol-3-phosphate dehydrogenase [Calditrichota bacterium]
MLDKKDVVIIGGGINGAGIARDLGLRGISAVLFEKNDFSSGTSAASTRLIHGGLRYLEYFDFKLVHESLTERKILLKIAPHLVFPLPFLLPVYTNHEHGRFLLKAGLTLYDILALGKKLPGHKLHSSSGILQKEHNLRQADLKGGFTYYDCQVPLPERLTVENILDAEQHGVTCNNYHEVIAVEQNGNDLFRVQVQDENGKELEIECKVVINASGPWVNEIASFIDGVNPRLVGGTKGSHIIVRNSIELRHAIYSPAFSDGRPFFILPFERENLLIGTTDLFFDNQPQEAHICAAEIEYLEQETNALLPEIALKKEDILMTYSGIRPLPPVANGKKAGAVTRRHFLHRHVKDNRETGFISVIGGKITTYRQLAEEVSDLVCELLAIDKECLTSQLRLPGANGLEQDSTQLLQFSHVENNYQLIYGAGREEKSQRIAEKPDTLNPVYPDAPETIADIISILRHEKVCHLSDVLLRRSLIGLRIGADKKKVEQIAWLLSDELGWGARKTAAEIELYEREISRSFQWKNPDAALCE